MATLHQHVDYGLGFLGGDREADADIAARRRIDRGVDAHHIAGHVEHRATGVARIDRRVGLDVAVIGAAADRAVDRRDDAGGDGAAQRERVADRDHPVANAGARRIAELHEGQRLGRVDLEHGEIGSAVAADDVRLVFGAIGKRDGDRFQRRALVLTGLPAGDDVVVGDDVAVGRDDKARAQRHRLARHRLAVGIIAAAAAAIVAALELAEQIVERRAGERVGLLRHLHALGGGDVHDRRLQTRGEIGEARRATHRPVDGGSRILRDLGADRLLHRQRGGGTAREQRGCDGIGITHDGRPPPEDVQSEERCAHVGRGEAAAPGLNMV